ncbi:hypothetical protein [Paraburkholderia haematera]|uniref:Antitoxin VbhA domain-containing protein n=1 Tax=Paraburkholderia haematera TaxID=2793077 RepID=A0ABM8QTI3_9BURK|nr:hypothetical protein [Paraburkholderia haematera]CAE6714548.1 hypothetical protein R69888_01310 [Paraburkholderia haematera]
MKDNFLGLKTDQNLLKKLERAADRKPSQAEIIEQRVSYVFGFMKPDSGVTREQVRDVIAGKDGAIGGAAR